jgi:hypothetical protein
MLKNWLEKVDTVIFLVCEFQKERKEKIAPSIYYDI